MGPNACGTGRPVLRPPGGGTGALGVGLALVAVLYGSSAVPLGDGQIRVLRQSEMTTESTAMNLSAPDVWWWVFLIVLVVVAGAIAVTCLLACCIIKRSRRRTRQLEAIHLNYQMCSDTHLMSHSESPQKFSTSGHSSSPLGMGDQSSQVSSSSLLLGEKGKWRRPSPGHSSGSEEGFKPRGSRTSLASSHSSVHGVRLAGADSQSSVERLSSGRSGRRRSGAVVHVTKLCDDSNLSLVSAPSTASMQSAYSAAHASDLCQPAAVEVDVTVGAGSTGQDAQVTTAAALAESARQLAQSAAEFGEESMWEMYRKRSGPCQKRFVTIRNGVYSPATMHRLLSRNQEGVPPAVECHLDVPSGLDSPDIVPSHGSSSPTHPFKLPPGRSYTNGTLPHLVPELCGGASGCFTREEENCGNSPGSPHLDRRFSYHSHLNNEGWERRSVCDPCGSYSPPHVRSGPTSTHLRQVGQRNGSESVGRELKPTRRVWQDVEVPLNTTPSVVTDSSTESAPPSSTQSHGESTVNHSTINEEEVPQVRQPSSSRPKSAPAVAKTTSSKQGLPLSLQDTPTSPTTEKNHQSRGSSVHSLVVPSLEVHAKEDVSPSRSASSGNLQPRAPLQISKQGIESETSCILFRLKRQTSVPNFRYSSHHPLLPSAATAGPDNHSSRSLARTSSAMSIGGVESAQSGYLASDGSSLTLDGEQDFVPSCVALRNGEWNGHVDSLLSPTSPLGNELFDSMFEQHIRQYSNTSSASSANQSTCHCTVSPPLRTRELEIDRLYRALPRRSSATAKKLLSPPDYHPRWSTTSNEGVDV